MKTKLIAVALFGTTLGALAFYPALQVGALQANPPVIEHPAIGQGAVEVVFVLDTTGSMGGMLETAKEKIWSIASSLASAHSAPRIRMGLVAYRDRGDSYVTRVIDLSNDLDAVYSALLELQAAGGGDGPESVNQALQDALEQISWSQDTSTYRTVFLVGDATPHMDYQDDIKYPVILNRARQRGILVNSIQCGRNGDTEQTWREIASLGGGRYFQVDQSGGALALTTPFDEKIAKVSAALDQTRLYYGNAKLKAANERKKQTAEKLHSELSAESQARRAAYHLTPSGRSDFLGENELLDDLASGRVQLSDIPQDYLPEPLQAMAPDARLNHIQDTTQQRQKLEEELQIISRQRADYIAGKVNTLDGKAHKSLDRRIYDTVREQAAAVGLEYDRDALKY